MRRNARPYVDRVDDCDTVDLRGGIPSFRGVAHGSLRPRQAVGGLADF